MGLDLNGFRIADDLLKNKEPHNTTRPAASAEGTWAPPRRKGTVIDDSE
jgi:hypothetical protein